MFNKCIILIGMLFSFNAALASQQVLTCGPVIDINLPENEGLCTERDNCGLLVASQKYLSPWMEMWLNAEGLLPSLSFLDGVPTLLKFSNEDVLFSQFEMAGETLNMKFVTLAGDEPIQIEFNIVSNFLPSDVKGAAYFEGLLSVKLMDDDLETLPFACLYQ